MKPVFFCDSEYHPAVEICSLDSRKGRKQVAVATAQILFQRFWYVTSMKQFGIGVRISCQAKVHRWLTISMCGL